MPSVIKAAKLRAYGTEYLAAVFLSALNPNGVWEVAPALGPEGGVFENLISNYITYATFVPPLANGR
jgi:hypothetical protein